MAIAFAPNYGAVPNDFTGAQIVVTGTLTFTGSYVTGGDTLSFLGFDVVKSTLPPIRVVVNDLSATGYTFAFVPGTTQGNGLLQVFQGGASASNPQAQISAAAYPAAILAGSFTVTAYFQSY